MKKSEKRKTIFSVFRRTNGDYHDVGYGKLAIENDYKSKTRSWGVMDEGRPSRKEGSCVIGKGLRRR